jgi:hypothetical protein
MRSFLLFLTTLFAFSAAAQTAEDSVKTVINTLFTAMKNADGPLLTTVFAQKAVLQTVTRKNGEIAVDTDSPEEFASLVSQIKKDSADERIVFETVKIDGPLAMVWAPYKFYYAGIFSHCGIDAFQLVRFKEGWKIQYLIDTRRRNGCP